MAVQKPSKPDVTLPNNFGGTKTPYTDSQISNGYQEAVPQVVDGGNINYEKDAVFKYLKYLKTVIDALVDMPIGKSIVIDANNRFEYISPENSANKTGTINASSTENQYPNAKAVYDAIKDFDSSLFLHLSGDETFSGVKICQSDKPRFGFKNTNADISNKPSALTNSKLFFADKNDFWTSEIRNEISTTGYSETAIYTNSKTSGTLKTSYIKVVVDANGAVYATCPTPPAAGDNSTKISTTQWVSNKFKVVSTLPAAPDANVFYFIPED